MNQGQFRKDLYYRLQVVNIHLPPLRERKEEIIDLVQALLARINHEMHRNITQVSKDVIECMLSYDWPGNIRELENVLAKAIALCPGNTITRDLVSHICDARTVSETRVDDRPLNEWSLTEVEKAHVLRVLQITNWHKGQACKILGVSRPRLRRMIRQYQLTPPADVVDDEIETDGEDE